MLKAATCAEDSEAACVAVSALACDEVIPAIAAVLSAEMPVADRAVTFTEPIAASCADDKAAICTDPRTEIAE